MPLIYPSKCKKWFVVTIDLRYVQNAAPAEGLQNSPFLRHKTVGLPLNGRKNNGKTGCKKELIQKPDIWYNTVCETVSAIYMVGIFGCPCILAKAAVFFLFFIPCVLLHRLFFIPDTGSPDAYLQAV